MSFSLAIAQPQDSMKLAVFRDVVRLRTEKTMQFVDLTALVSERVRRSGVRIGLVTVQVLHTTAAVLVNENEPRLIDDLMEALERMAPRTARYAHDKRDSGASDESGCDRSNGHAHCKALALSPSIALQIDAGCIQLGRHQRIFLVELDCAQNRGVSIVVLGLRSPSGRRWEMNTLRNSAEAQNRKSCHERV
jgi:secondary thiamine-phosphate synthase enzyme